MVQQAGKLVTASTSQQVQEGASDEKGKESTEEVGDISNACKDQDDNNRERSPSRQQKQSLTKREIRCDSNLDDLLHKQSANFQALIRAAANLQVDLT